MEVIRYSASEWKSYSDQAHLICFNETDRSKIELIDYALMVVDNEKPLIYITVKQLDSEAVYMQYGGAFPDTKGTALSFRAFMDALEFIAQTNKYISMYVENVNTPMLKFAMKAGFRIVGIKTIRNNIFLEHYMEV